MHGSRRDVKVVSDGGEIRLARPRATGGAVANKSWANEKLRGPFTPLRACLGIRLSRVL